MGLMQLVRELSSKDGTKVWWIVGDRKASELALSTMSKDAAVIWCAELTKTTSLVKLAVVVLDDFSKAPIKSKQNFLAFFNECKKIASHESGLRLVFVLGSVGAVSRWTEHRFELTLTPTDKQQCYKKMAMDEPRVLDPNQPGLNAVLLQYSQERWYSNDAPAFIDFLMEHGGATKVAKTHWLAQITGLEATELDIVTHIAVAQLVGLHVEESVALSSLGGSLLSTAKNLEHFACIQHLVVVDQDGWKGLGLSSARRARDVLIRANRFNVDFIERTLSLFLDAAIKQMRLNGHSATPAGDFARHIFQRLGKKALFQFSNKSDIFQRLVLTHAVNLRLALGGHDPAKKARWAGTLSAMQRITPSIAPDMAAAQAALTDLLCGLCQETINYIKAEPSSSSPEILLGLYRAGARMTQSSWLPKDRAEAVCKSIKSAVTADIFWRAFRSEFDYLRTNAAHRCNELLHVRIDFEEGLNGERRGFNFVSEMTELLSTAELDLRGRNCSLDAANWLMRSKYVWIPKRSPEELEHAVATRACYLANAMRCLAENPESQGTWNKHVHDAVKAFVKKNPSFQGNFN